MNSLSILVVYIDTYRGIIFNTRSNDEALVQEKYLENTKHNKLQPIVSKEKEVQDSTKEGKKKWKGKDKKPIAREHYWKDLKNHYNHCNIYGYTKDKCCKLHPDLNPKNHKKDAKMKLLAMDSSKEVGNNYDVYENIFYTIMKKEVNMSFHHHKEEKDMIKIFYIKIEIKKTKVDSLFDSSLKCKLIEEYLVSNIGLEVHSDYPHPYPLG